MMLSPRPLDNVRKVRYADLVIIHYEIPDDLHRELKVRAAQEGVTLKELIVRYLTEGLDRRPDPWHGRRRWVT